MAEPVLHLFTGENDYALTREVIRWKQGFSRKHGAENLLVLRGKDATLSGLLDAVAIMPFIAEKRLVLIEGLPRIDKEDFKTFVDGIHPDVITAIVEPSLDKRLGVTKVVLELAQVKEFPLPSPKDLKTWAKGIVAAEKATISENALTLLFDIVGSDQWMLEGELKKLALFASGGEILPAHVEAMAVPSGEQVVWRLTDLIGGKNIEGALAFLRGRLERGEDAYGLWVVLLNMVKNVVLVWSGLDAGLRDERSISAAFGMHFLSVRGILPLVRSLDRRRIEKLVAWTTDADLALKTGGHHYSAERQNELIALNERTILLCGNAA